MINDIYSELSNLQSPILQNDYLLNQDVPYETYLETLNKLNSTEQKLRELINYTTNLAHWAEYWKKMYDNK
jgi:hypothetical protein